MFRDYTKKDSAIRDSYRDARINQTLKFNQKVRKIIRDHEWKQYYIWDVILFLDDFVDRSDGDISLPNSHHLFQTAEGLRKDGHPEWLQVTGLIHDLGKFLYYIINNEEYGMTKETQWGIVGDTFISGCRIPDSIVYKEFNKLNPDTEQEWYDTETGVYQPGAGLMNVLCSYGHDEYLYEVLQRNEHRLPMEALYIIRFHSLYLWHTENEYSALENEDDKKNKELVKLFNKYDLYTKENTEMNPNIYRRHYEPLLRKYLGDDGVLWW